MTLLYSMQDGAAGGIARRVMAVATSLQSRGARVIVSMPLGAAAASLMRRSGLDVREVPCLRLRRSRNPLYYAGWVLVLPVTAAALARIIVKERVDIVYDNQITQLQAALAARLTGRRLVWHLIGLHEPVLVERLFFPFVLRWADRIVVSSDARGRRCRELHRYRGPYDIVHPPVDVERFRPAQGAYTRVGPLDAPVIGTVCHLNRLKGVDVLLRVARQVKDELPGAQFVVVGPSVPSQRGYFRDLRDLRARLGLEETVTFAGPREDVPEVLQRLDIFVLTSRNESAPMVVLEAMATGLPVVASRVGGVVELVRDGVDGILCDAGNVAQFSEAIVGLARDPGVRRDLGVSARASVQDRFALSIVAAKTAALLRDVQQEAS
jgi:glycosyltransferase involved in cell wall biosynthesis